jgi:mannosyltransferase OCH1-like enzyme
MKIPKRIFQIALGNDYIKKIPKELIKNNLLNINKDYKYEFFTDMECEYLVKEYYPQYVELYNKLERPQYKSDLIRYLSLHKDGGYYIDIDLFLIVGFDNFINNWSSFFTIGAHHNGKLEMANGFMGSIPGNPIFIELVEEMKKDYNPVDYGMNVKRMYSILNNKIGVEQFNCKNDTYFLREFGTNIGVYVINVDSNNTICISNCSGYPYDMSKLSLLLGN